MKTIVVPTDFSEGAANALQYAAALADRISASIHLVHIYQLPVVLTETPLVFVSVDELREAAERRLNAAAEKITSSNNIYTLTRMGDTVDELGLICNELQPFAVVMATSAQSGLERSIFGSTTTSAIRHLDWPVICVPPTASFAQGIKKAGLACDLKDVGDTVPVHAVKTFVETFGCELHILNVANNIHQAKLSAAEEATLLDTVFKDVSPRFHYIENTDVEDGLNQFAETNGLDVLITIPKKHGLLEGLFKKSSTSQLLVGSHIPIVCMHA